MTQTSSLKPVPSTDDDKPLTSVSFSGGRYTYAVQPDGWCPEMGCWWFRHEGRVISIPGPDA